MIDRSKPVDIKKTILEITPIKNAFQAGLRAAANRHKQSGEPMVILRNGEIVWISADEFLRELDAHEEQFARERQEGTAGKATSRELDGEAAPEFEGGR